MKRVQGGFSLASVDRYGIPRVIFEMMYLHSIKNLPSALCPLPALEPNYLTDEVLGEMMETVIRHREGINKGAIFRGVKW